MIRFLLKLSLLMSLAFMLAIGLIRAQPYDDGGLRDFLFNSPGCENIPDDQPCFMGIRPGIALHNDAWNILEVNEWVESVSSVRFEPYKLVWHWNGQQSQFIQSSSDGLLYLSGIQIEEVETQSIIPNGQLFLSLGLPEDVSYYQLSNPRGLVVNLYYESGLIGEMQTICPISYTSFWATSVNLRFVSLERHSGFGAKLPILFPLRRFCE